MARRDDAVSRLARELAEHDAALAARGVAPWIGAEPTYTHRGSESPEWLYEALGGSKEALAGRMCARLAVGHPGAALLRPAGRPYAGEEAPRWCFGVYARRDGVPVWSGPPDPLARRGGGPAAGTDGLAEALVSALRAAAWTAAACKVAAPLALRVTFRLDGAMPPGRVVDVPEIGRPSLHGGPVEGALLRDDLAEGGLHVIAAGAADDACTGVRCLRLELPAMPDPDAFQALLAVVARALGAVSAPCAVLAGFPPPVDASVSWTTLTPDPAVVEVNMAPEERVADFHRALERVEAAARGEGLSPRRLHYNGLETDSGGGGQITLGGASAAASPFISEPRLLPGLVRYFNRHPSLSYYWAAEAVGAASQGPRADEGTREAWRELDLALALLDREPAAAPEVLQRALAPFMVDVSGNAHRSELNIEKLWGDALGQRGRLGLVEFRSLRMPAEPATLTAIAALLRALVAMLAARPTEGPLVDWGDRLHDRYSLPFYLRQDLDAVLADLEAAGLAPGPGLRARLLDDAFRIIARPPLPGAALSLRRAVEFWPLIGDVASQERGGARLVDASTARLELRLRGDAEDLEGWRASCAGVALPLRTERDGQGTVRVCGVRYRCFAPLGGLHPTLASQVPLVVRLEHPRHGAHVLAIHEWRPGGGPYPGLPEDAADAARRRAGRCLLEPAAEPAPAPRPAPPRACGEHVLDLRWLAP